MANARDLDNFKERLEVCDEIEFDLNGQSWNLEPVYKGVMQLLGNYIKVTQNMTR